MKIRRIVLLLLVLAVLLVLVPLLLMGYIPLPSQDVLGNGGGCYLEVRTNPVGLVGIFGEGWYERCTDVTLNAPELVEISIGARYRFAYWDVDDVNQETDQHEISVHMDCHHTATAHYVAQFYLTMMMNHGTVTPGDGWYDSGSEVPINAFAPATVSGERYVWNGWSGTGAGNYAGSDKEALVTMNSPVNETASWTHQYYLEVVSSYGTPGGEGWYDSAVSAHATLDTGTVDHGNGTRRLFLSWSEDASGMEYYQSDPIIMDKPKTTIARWKTQHSLTVTSTLGGTTDPQGSEWFDEDTIVAVLALPDVDYELDNWTLDTVTAGPVNPLEVTMNTTHILHGVFVPSPGPTYFLSVEVDPDGITTIPGEGWYGESETVSLTASERVMIDTSVQYNFQYWDVDGIPWGIGIKEITILMDANHTATAHYKQKQPVVGGSTVSISSHLFQTWLNIDIALVVSVVLLASWKKKRQQDSNGLFYPPFSLQAHAYKESRWRSESQPGN